MRWNLFVLSWMFVPCVLAAELPKPPPLSGEPVAEQKYFDVLYRHWNKLHVVTTSPNGTRYGELGDLIAYNASGTWKLCLNISSGPGAGTTWRCSANALSAP